LEFITPKYCLNRILAEITAVISYPIGSETFTYNLKLTRDILITQSFAYLCWDLRQWIYSTKWNQKNIADFSQWQDSA